MVVTDRVLVVAVCELVVYRALVLSAHQLATREGNRAHEAESRVRMYSMEVQRLSEMSTSHSLEVQRLTEASQQVQQSSGWW